MSSPYHVPVMLDEVLEHLITTKNGTYVDGTLGGGGHAEQIMSRIFPQGTLIGIDADIDAIEEAKKKLQPFHPNVRLVHNNTDQIMTVLRSLNISAIDGLLLDLGVSSFQLDNDIKGFSFRGNQRLDMRMDVRQPLDAHTVVNTYDERRLSDIFWKYGEERFSRNIARAIIDARMTKAIETTGELAGIVESTVKGPMKIKSMARIFQSIRIEVNDELGRLKSILNDSLGFLTGGARIVVIAYHSLEDRIVKQFFQERASALIPSGNKYLPDTPRRPELRIITKRPMTATAGEREKNPRSRSAKMRVAERIGE